MKNKKIFGLALCLLVAFGLWTAGVCLLDVAPIGPEETRVGFSACNGFVHKLTGVHMSLYAITDWLGLVPFAFVFGFAILGLVQWIARRKLRHVDRSILLLGGFYVLVMGAYLLFESVTINYRPVLIQGRLELSYPSSTTMLVLCVMPTAMMQLSGRIRNALFRNCTMVAMGGFTAFMVVGRLISGVHWFSDIVGGLLLSAGLVLLYRGACKMK